MISPQSSKPSSLRSVVARVILVTALGAGAIAATLGLFFAANGRLRAANEESARASRVSAAAFGLRAQMVALDDALRAVIRGNDPGAVSRWRQAERGWQQPSLTLARAAATNQVQEQRTEALRAEIQAYISDYGDLVVQLATISPQSIRASDANSEGRTRLQQIIGDTDAIARFASLDATDKSDAASSLAHQATLAGVVALVLTPILLIVLGIWLARFVAEPLRQTVSAASSVAAGDFDVRLDERRRDEFGELARAFNAMTGSLATSRRELIERAERLEQSERHKSELISMVSHEVRTPLASVLGFTRLLLDRELSEDDRLRYLQIVDAEATRLATLVSDFLDARLIEEGQFALNREPFDLRMLVLEQAEVALAHADTHEVEVDLPEAPVHVDADRGRLAQVVGNVLSNAVKYSPGGGTIRIGADTSSGLARVWVDDEGAGIAPEHRTQLFEPFYRGGAAAAGIPGTGLGLAVSRRIVEAHDGHIGFDSLKRGTRFWFDLPLDGASDDRALTKH